MSVTRHRGDRLQERLDLEPLVSDLSAQFVQLSPAEVDPAIRGGLPRLLEFFACDRCGLLAVEQDPHWATVRDIFCASGIPEVSGDVHLAELLPFLYARIVLPDGCLRWIAAWGRLPCRDDLLPDCLTRLLAWSEAASASPDLEFRFVHEARGLDCVAVQRGGLNPPETP